jgi:hypothetical protein
MQDSTPQGTVRRPGNPALRRLAAALLRLAESGRRPVHQAEADGPTTTITLPDREVRQPSNRAA